MDFPGYFFTRLLAELFRFVPFWLLYPLSDGLAFVLHRVVGYRRQVMWDNLRRSFPDKPDDELQRIMQGAYRNLTDITLETVKGFTAPLAEIRRRAIIRNPELVNQYLEQGQSVIISASHLNNWEWAGLSMPGPMAGLSISAFKPLTNKLVDRYYNRRRSRGGLIMVSMDETFRAVRKYRDQPAVYFLIGDQSPTSRKSAQWLTFLNQDSAFMPGIEFLARRFNYPVLYFHVDRLRRGYYEVSYLEVWPDPAAAGETDITRAFARVVEEAIHAQPENWLWSHKRWKMTRQEAVV